MRTFHIQLVCLCGLFLLACTSLSNCKRPGPGEKTETAEIAAKVKNAGPATNEARVSEEESGKRVEVEGKVEDKVEGEGKAGKPQSGKKPAGKKEEALKAAPPAPAKAATSKEEEKARATPDKVEKPEPPEPSKPLPTPEENKTGQTTAVSLPSSGNGEQPEEEAVSNDNDEAPGATQVPPEMEEEAPAPSKPVPSGTSLPDIQPMSCSDPSLSFDQFILAAAKNFEKRKIKYDRNAIPPSDCSGMFHQLVQAVKSNCPDFLYPDLDEARDTRSLARWYNDHDNLVIIQKDDAASSGRLIRPGSVMFFGNSGVPYTNITIDKLAVQGGIEHMGTVVDVEKDGAGKVIGYSMFHGRNPSEKAGITQHKLKNVSRKKGALPPFGNFDQQWVAVANIATAQGQPTAKVPPADNGSGGEPASPGETMPADNAHTASAGTTAPATPPDEGQAGGAVGEAATPESGANLKALPAIQPMSCSDQGLSFDDFILAAAKNFEKQKIAYNSIPLSDCSGMFHRLVLAVKDFCPAYQYPESEEARDTRSLARWYHDNNNLVIIQKEEAATSGHLIRPGSVMFFGNSNVSYTNITIDKLAVQGGIEHMGTVVDVEKDGAGKVIGYTMFHGRNPRHPAGTTKHKLKNVSFSRGVLPSFGNWDQQWVAVANIATQ